MPSDLETFTADSLTNARSLDFVRFVACVNQNIAHQSINSFGHSTTDQITVAHAAEIFTKRWPRSPSLDIMRKSMDWSHKAAVNPGTTVEPSWASPMAQLRPLVEAFIDIARPASLLGKLTAAARVPFNVSVPAQTGGGTYRWVGQGAPKPVGNLQLTATTLPILKASGLIIVTSELLRLNAPGAVETLRREMIRGMSQYLDGQLTDPAAAAVAGVSPASITNGAPSIASAGTSAANAATDIKALIAAFAIANPNAESMVLLMSPGVAVAVAVAVNTQTLGPNGGTVFGVPVLTGGVGGRVIAVDPTALLLADDGALDVTIARHASVEMEGTATSPPTASTVTVNLWQLNLVGLMIDRFIHWRMARANAVLYTNVTYI